MSRKKTNAEPTLQKENEYNFQWFEVEDETNPFNKKILDVRSFTWSVVATTQDENIAKTFSLLRSSLGQEYIGMDVKDGRTASVDLEYPHNGDELKGVVFRSDSMEIKWDIYIYDDIFYFVRSWTGELIYKACTQILSDKIVIDTIEFPTSIDTTLAKSDIHFLLKTHAMGQVLPHQIPEDFRIIDSTKADSELPIALYSFRQFGNKGCYACFEDITDTEITIKR